MYSPKERGVFKPNFKKKSLKLNWNFLGGEGVQRKKNLLWKGGCGYFLELHNVDLSAPVISRITADTFNICLEGEGAEEVTKVVSYEQNNKLGQGIFHEFTSILCVLLLGVPWTFGQGCC